MATIIEFHIPTGSQGKVASGSRKEGKLIEFPLRFTIDEVNQSATLG